MKIVFITKEGIGVHSFEPLALEARKRNHEVVFSNDLQMEGDIGFYCDDRSQRGRQSIAVVSINGLDQDHVDRPNYTKWFAREHWSDFDLGVLPGPRWFRGWQQAESLGASLKHGVVTAGWPKSDILFAEGDPLVKKLREGHARRVLYAPQTEQDGKQSAVIKQLEGRDISLTIKHWENESYTKLYPTLLTSDYMENLAMENSAAQERRWINLMDSASNFMELLPQCDLLITDQSSVLYEAVLVGAPTLVVKDWKHACGTCGGPQPSPDACAVTSEENIGRAVEEIFNNYNFYVHKALTIRNDNFVNLGFSSKVIIDSVERIYRSMNSVYGAGMIKISSSVIESPCTQATQSIHAEANEPAAVGHRYGIWLVLNKTVDLAKRGLKRCVRALRALCLQF